MTLPFTLDKAFPEDKFRIYVGCNMFFAADNLTQFNWPSCHFSRALQSDGSWQQVLLMSLYRYQRADGSWQGDQLEVGLQLLPCHSGQGRGGTAEERDLLLSLFFSGPGAGVVPGYPTSTAPP